MLISCSLHMRMVVTATLTGMLEFLAYSMHSLFTLASTQNPVNPSKWTSFGSDGSAEILEQNGTPTLLVGRQRGSNG
jgi:hypothetical protein